MGKLGAEVLDVLVESLWRGGKAREPAARESTHPFYWAAFVAAGDSRRVQPTGDPYN